MSRNSQTRPSFYITDEEILVALHELEEDSHYNTTSTYSANTTLYPDNEMSFAEKHASYLKIHKTVNPEQYISNLKLMTKIN